MAVRPRISRPNLYRLAAESCRDPKTVERVVAGGGTAQSRAAVEKAAAALGITLPAVPGHIGATSAAQAKE
jgi:hypothetical protein